MQLANRNSEWIGRVSKLLKAGFGVEDIAIKMNCHVDHIRDEVDILRLDGQLEKMFGSRNG